MSSASSKGNEPESGIAADTPLVISVEQGPLRAWIISELAPGWQGSVEIVELYNDVYEAVREVGGDPVVLICGEQLLSLLEDDDTRWTRVADRATVVLVESRDNVEIVNRLLSHVDAVLLRELHRGMALEIVQSAARGIKALPPEVLQLLIARHSADSAERAGSNGSGGAGRAREKRTGTSRASEDTEAGKTKRGWLSRFLRRLKVSR